MTHWLLKESDLAAKLQKSGYSREQLEAIKKYTRELAAGLDEAEEDFASRRHVVEMLNVYAKLVVENDEKVAYVTCVFKIKNKARAFVDIAPSYKFFGPDAGALYGKCNLLNELRAYKVRPASNGLPYKFETGTQIGQAAAD